MILFSTRYTTSIPSVAFPRWALGALGQDSETTGLEISKMKVGHHQAVEQLPRCVKSFLLSAFELALELSMLLDWNYSDFSGLYSYQTHILHPVKYSVVLYHTVSTLQYCTHEC